MNEAVRNEIIVTVLSALPPTIAAFAAYYQSRRNSRISKDLVVKTEHVIDRTRELDAIKSELAEAHERVKELQALVETISHK